jgi:hypothetical protein
MYGRVEMQRRTDMENRFPIITDVPGYQFDTFQDLVFFVHSAFYYKLPESSREGVKRVLLQDKVPEDLIDLAIEEALRNPR